MGEAQLLRDTDGRRTARSSRTDAKTGRRSDLYDMNGLVSLAPGLRSRIAGESVSVPGGSVGPIRLLLVDIMPADADGATLAYYYRRRGRCSNCGRV
jgi:hypothetical protein